MTTSASKKCGGASRTLSALPRTRRRTWACAVRVGEELFTPLHVSAMILRQIKEDCTSRLACAVEGATITVPAYFQDCQREATRAAGEAAGLRLRPLLDEPIAAALAFSQAHDPSARHRLLVYDLGGGTFDVSVVFVGGDNVQVLTKEGDMWLGGDDFDHLLVERLHAWLEDRYGLRVDGNPALLRRLKVLAQTAKHALSTREVYQVRDPTFTHDPDRGKISLNLTVTRTSSRRRSGPWSSARWPWRKRRWRTRTCLLSI